MNRGHLPRLVDPTRCFLDNEGGDGGAGGQGGSGGSGGGSGGGGKGDEKLFTQDELSRRATAEREQGERAGRRAILEELGVGSADEAKAAVQAATAARRAEEERTLGATEAARRAADEDRATAARLKADALRDRNVSRVHVALMAAGLGDTDAKGETGHLARVAKLVDVDLAAENLDESAVTAAVAKLKDSVPALWAQQHEDETDDERRDREDRERREREDRRRRQENGGGAASGGPAGGAGHGSTRRPSGREKFEAGQALAKKMNGART